MRKLIMLGCAVLLSTHVFANDPSSSLTKDSATLKALGTAFKSQPALPPTENKNDITMVYGGQDISSRPTIVPLTITA